MRAGRVLSGPGHFLVEFLMERDARRSTVWRGRAGCSERARAKSIQCTAPIRHLGTTATARKIPWLRCTAVPFRQGSEFLHWERNDLDYHRGRVRFFDACPDQGRPRAYHFRAATGPLQYTVRPWAAESPTPDATEFDARRRSVQINISARHGHLSTQTQQLVTEKVQKVQRFHDRINSILVTCDLEHRDQPQVEVQVTVEHAGEFVATDSDSSLIGALDRVVHKIEQQLRKHKEKITEHRAPGHRQLASDMETE